MRQVMATHVRNFSVDLAFRQQQNKFIASSHIFPYRESQELTVNKPNPTKACLPQYAQKPPIGGIALHRVGWALWMARGHEPLLVDCPCAHVNIMCGRNLRRWRNEMYIRCEQDTPRSCTGPPILKYLKATAELEAQTIRQLQHFARALSPTKPTAHPDHLSNVVDLVLSLAKQLDLSPAMFI